jgi:hypothetical protein
MQYNPYIYTMKLILPLLLLSLTVQAQPPKAKTIIIKGTTFTEVCSKLLDNGYSIEKKDEQLQTARTEHKMFPKHNAAYRIDIRVKDSTAFITGTFTAPYDQFLTPAARKVDPLWNNDPAYYQSNKKGKPTTLPGIAFDKIKEFALSVGKEVEYQ